MNAVRKIASFLSLLVVVTIVVVGLALARASRDVTGPGSVGSPQPVTAESSPSASPSVPPSPDAPGTSRCVTEIAYGVKVANTVAGESAFSDLVVTGTVLSVSPARWATADGTMPVTVNDRPPGVGQVYRVIRVKVTGVGKATGLAGARAGVGQVIEVRIIGGTIGCSTFQVAGEPEVVPGLDIALFLLDGSQPPLKAAPPADFDVFDNWAIAGGRVKGPDGTEMTPEAFLAASAATP